MTRSGVYPLFLILLLGVAFAIPPDSSAQLLQDRNGDLLTFSLQGLPWAIEVNAPGFDEFRINPDTTRGMGAIGFNRTTGFMIMIILHKSETPLTGKDLREFVKKMHVDTGAENIETWQLGEISVLEFLKTDPKKGRSGKYLEAYSSREGFDIMFWLTQPDYKQGDDEAMFAILKTVRINDSYRRSAGKSRSMLFF